MFLLNNKKINIATQLTIGDVRYPPGYFCNPTARMSAGIIEVPDPVYPDQRFFYTQENEDGSLTATPKSIEQCKEVVRQIITDRRYNKEVDGVDVNGVTIATDRVSQGKVAGALIFLQRNPQSTINWKSESGWVQLTLSNMEAVADAVGSHVQQCFTEEMLLLQQLEMLMTPEEVIAFCTTLQS